ncbi:hypothetical protein ABKN59_006757 [Abortiporus biennis]
MFSSSSTPSSSCSHSHTSSAPNTNHSESSTACVNHGAPQCCHCGWRGAHAPTCPFK